MIIHRKKWTPCLNLDSLCSLIALCLSFSVQKFQFWLIGHVLMRYLNNMNM